MHDLSPCTIWRSRPVRYGKRYGKNWQLVNTNTRLVVGWYGDLAARPGRASGEGAEALNAARGATSLQNYWSRAGPSVARSAARPPARARSLPQDAPIIAPFLAKECNHGPDTADTRRRHCICCGAHSGARALEPLVGRRWQCNAHGRAERSPQTSATRQLAAAWIRASARCPAAGSIRASSAATRTRRAAWRAQPRRGGWAESGCTRARRSDRCRCWR